MDNTTPTTAPNTARRTALTRLSVALAIAGLAAGAYWFLALRHHQATDDAYVAGNLIPVSSQVAGSIVAIHADDTQSVKAGDLLLTLDRNDAQLAYARAAAELAQAVRQTRQLISVSGKSDALVAQRAADVARAEADVARASGDLARREAAARDQAIAGEELQHARDAANSARLALSAARAALKVGEEEQQASRALVLSDSAEQQPAVARAAAALRESYLALARTEIRAPVAGQIARRSAQPGARIQPGTPLLAVAALDSAWVDANFKEGQLRELRIGQPVELHADLYGDDVTYHGTVAGLAAGTGSVFSLLPAQNATGNWIKVVQRVPVRIALQPQELQQHPLRLGLSMSVSVDTSQQDGPLLTAARRNPALSTSVFERQLAQADQAVAKIIAANLGR
ncbi:MULTISPECIES: HlyD family efflux transporter periplasmic adaptor subunit [Vogesella]|uniref:HlyD family secretion protein n=1 Tax=Vogesella TaxID=57739 RepID=UPI00210A95A6|nr:MULTISPECIES: HlyD family efflux transporter periplasmic adaptor subunit [Vogesella]MCQ4142907.1 HlyD family efflux transporter periplasmic adaptor subunit [Vogesella sp. AC12]MDC7698305.1 HlyD family efflux transporter periplasmic adaptor subunit [Vogesella indigofera]